MLIYRQSDDEGPTCSAHALSLLMPWHGSPTSDVGRGHGPTPSQDARGAVSPCRRASRAESRQPVKVSTYVRIHINTLITAYTPGTVVGSTKARNGVERQSNCQTSLKSQGRRAAPALSPQVVRQRIRSGDRDVDVAWRRAWPGTCRLQLRRLPRPHFPATSK